MTRRSFLRRSAFGILSALLCPPLHSGHAAGSSELFWITEIPEQPFSARRNPNYHTGVDTLLHVMGSRGLKLHRSARNTVLSGPQGLIEPGDIVLIKVNAQWKYRGCTNSDLIRGLIQRILEHPDGFAGEIVLFENGQGRGSLNCDNDYTEYGLDRSVQANANDPGQSFAFLTDTVFRDSRVSSAILDPIRTTFIEPGDHARDGYRILENVSYPCFTTKGGRRVELREGIWRGNGYTQNLKLINVPVLKYHDSIGAQITASLKHLYGILSMEDGQRDFRHYSGLGESCGKMVAAVRAPVLNILDAIWVSHSSLIGYPVEATFRANQILAGQDPVALDYWATKYVFFPLRMQKNPDTPPDLLSRVTPWLTDAANVINARGGLYAPAAGIFAGQATQNEKEISVFRRKSLGVYNFNLRVAS